METSAKDSTNVEKAFMAMINDLESIPPMSPNISDNSHDEPVQRIGTMDPEL
jgi:hypothetical protein